MNRKEYRDYHAKICQDMQTIVQAKQADYCGGSDSPFANFEKVELLGICPTEVGMMTRMLDKFSRIQSFIQQGSLQVKDESVADSCIDLANYAILLAALFKQKREELDAALNMRVTVTEKDIDAAFDEAERERASRQTGPNGETETTSLSTCFIREF